MNTLCKLMAETLSKAAMRKVKLNQLWYLQLLNVALYSSFNKVLAARYDVQDSLTNIIVVSNQKKRFECQITASQCLNQMLEDKEVLGKVTLQRKFMAWLAKTIDSVGGGKKRERSIRNFELLKMLFYSKIASKQIIQDNPEFTKNLFLTLQKTFDDPGLLDSHLKAIYSFSKTEQNIEAIKLPTSVEILIGISTNSHDIELKEQIYKILANFLGLPVYISILKKHRILDSVRTAFNSAN